MEWVESTASTVEEAKDRVLDDLGIDEADAEIEVLEEPRPGLFGRTRGKARVRARVMPKAPAPKQERRGGGRSRKARAATDQGPEPTDAPPAAVDSSSSADEAPDDPPPAATTARRQRTPSPSTPTTPAAGGTRGRVEPEPSSSENGDGMGGGEILSFDDHVACVEAFVRGLVEAFAVEASVDVVEVDAETREVRVSGDDLGLMIGPRGLTIQAIHELARTVVYRRAPDGQEGRVRVDVAGYRQRRREALEQFARTIAEGVRSSGRSKALEPMAAPDRKVVHDAVNGVDGVRTTSEGDEPRRYVVVAPDA